MATTNNRKVYKFKSVGELESETRTNDESVANSVKLPIGIATPVSLGNNSLL